MLNILADDFYTVQSVTNTDQTVEASVILNADHDIFKGHFPNNPVTPGVCMLQIMKELLQTAYQRELFLSECSNVKFMALINPYTDPIVAISLQVTNTDQGFKVKGSASIGTTVALKIGAIFQYPTAS